MTTSAEDLNGLHQNARAGDGQDDSLDVLQELRARIEEALLPLGLRVEDLEQTVEQLRGAAKATTQYIRDRPLQSIGVAAGIGLLVGIFARRRR